MTQQRNVEARTVAGAGSLASREVNWYETFAFASRVAAQHGLCLDHRQLPVAGTLQWCGMADDDARKLLSLVFGGVREALANDARQDAITQAGEAISAAENWTEVARQVQRRREIDELRRAS